MVDLEKSRLHLQSVLQQGRPARRHRSHCQLKAGAVLTTTLSETASKAGSEALPGREALDAVVGATKDRYEGVALGDTNRFEEAILLAVSPSGIGVATAKSTHVHAGEEVTLSSGKDTNIAAGKSLLGSVVNSEIDDEIDDFLTWTLFGQKEEGQA